MERLCTTLNINDEEKSSLLIASAFHDVGQVQSREEHGLKSKEFLINNFEFEFKDNIYYKEILHAIEHHSDPCSSEYPLFTLLLQFSDKMDFSKDRLEENYRDKFGYICYESIDKVDFIYTDDSFGINIITSNVENFAELFLRESFTKKIIKAVEALAEKLNRKPIILNNGVKLSYSITR